MFSSVRTTLTPSKEPQERINTVGWAAAPSDLSWTCVPASTSELRSLGRSWLCSDVCQVGRKPGLYKRKPFLIPPASASTVLTHCAYYVSLLNHMYVVRIFLMRIDAKPKMVFDPGFMCHTDKWRDSPTGSHAVGVYWMRPAWGQVHIAYLMTGLPFISLFPHEVSSDFQDFKTTLWSYQTIILSLPTATAWCHRNTVGSRG